MTSKKRIRRVALGALAVAAVAVAAHLVHAHVDWYPAMGVHAFHVIAFRHYVSVGWVQVRPGHDAFRFFCDYLG